MRVDFGVRTFGEDKYKRDELFLRKVISLSKRIKIPIGCFHMAELQVSKYGFRYVSVHEVYRRLKRRLGTESIAKSCNLKMPQGISRITGNL